MTFSIGLDIGGSKIAGAVFDEAHNQRAQIVQPTPSNYNDLVNTCCTIVAELDRACGAKASLGVGVPGSVDRDSGVVFFAANTPCLAGMSLKTDLEKALGRSARLANDADCAALSEAIDGAGAGYKIVFGLIMGTGVGGGLVVDGRLVQGANGLTGEFGHTALPFRQSSDGPLVSCDCGQTGCIDKSISGPALARLYADLTGKRADAVEIVVLAQNGDAGAAQTLDHFMTVIAKAMIPVIHMFDPDVIAVSGGLSALPKMYEEVPKRLGRYAIRSQLKTRFVPAKYGAMSGLRGAAWRGAKDT